MSFIWPLALLALFILGYGLFVLFKVAVSRASVMQLEQFVDNKVWGAKLALRLVADADKHILAGHAGRFLCAFGSGVSAALFFNKIDISMFGPEVVASTAFVPQIVVQVLVALAIILPISIVAIIAVQLAKAVATHVPERILLALGWLCLAFSTLLFPILSVVDSLVGIFERTGSIQSPPSERDLALSAEDLESVIEQSTQAGTLNDTESELLQGALRLSETRVSEIMTPRADIVSVNIHCSLDDLREVFGGAGFSRVLVTGDHLDDVKGMLLAKDLIPLIGEPANSLPVEKYLREVVFVDGDATGDEVLKRLKSSQSHFAVVLDEHGGVDGIITLEDLIEEIVGDILDETDIPEEEQEITVTKSGDLLVDGGTSLSDLESEHGIELPEGEYDTIAGFIINQLGKIPEVGEQVRYNGTLLSVENVDENRITQLRITPEQDSQSAA